MTPAGLEPAIPGSVGRCLIHWATGPIDQLFEIDFQIVFGSPPMATHAWDCLSCIGQLFALLKEASNAGRIDEHIPKAYDQF